MLTPQTTDMKCKKGMLTGPTHLQIYQLDDFDQHPVIGGVCQ